MSCPDALKHDRHRGPMTRPTGWPVIMAAAAVVISMLGGCKARNTALPPAQAQPIEPAKPDWVSHRPVSNTYYIGIGLAANLRPDHREAAKKNALNDLASEISVNVEGNSLLHTLDRQYKVDEEFTSSIRTTTNERLEGYELMGTYEDADTYWIYYRLNKQEYARIKAERKKAALDQAADLFKRAKESWEGGDLRSAINTDLRGLLAMKEYWGENDEVLVDGEPVSLANEMFAHLKGMVARIRLGALPDRCTLNWENRFRKELIIKASKEEGGALPGLPLVNAFPGREGAVTERRNTDPQGIARTVVERVNLQAPSPELVIRVDMDAIADSKLEPTLVKPLLRSLATPELRVPIDRTMPRVAFRISESNLGEPVEESQLGITLKQDLSALGFRTVGSAADADLVIELDANTRELGESNGFFTAALDYRLKVMDLHSHETIYTAGKQGQKGIHLGYEKAGMDAYKKAALDLHKNAIPAMIGVIFQ